MDGSVPKGVVIFVHGFGSSHKCWEPLLTLLSRDPHVTSLYDLEYIDYPTTWFSLNPFQRIPRLKELSEYLNSFVESPRFQGREITLVGHSQGGLLILTYLAQLLQAGKGEELSSLRQVILMATPNLGSTIASSFRRVLSAVFTNPQERSLRVLDPEIADTQSVVRDRILHATTASDTTWPVPTHCFYGLRDNIVQEASARGSFYNVTPLDGDHFSILQPKDDHDDRYTKFVEALLYPAGHKSVFEVDGFDWTLSGEPVRQENGFDVRHGITTRKVQTDNCASLLRTITFSPTNQCRELYAMKYRTRNDGYVHPTMSCENEATPQEIGRYNDAGTESVFAFRPRAGGNYKFAVDVYKGFDQGHRDIHFHLRKDCYYKDISFKLDLTRYYSEGWSISSEPKFYLHRHDPINHDLCSQRGFGDSLKPVTVDPGGIWAWRIQGLRQGVFDLAWDLCPPTELGKDSKESRDRLQ